MAQSFQAFPSPDLSKKLICVWVHESSTGNNLIFFLRDLTQRTICYAMNLTAGGKHFKRREGIFRILILHKWGCPKDYCALQLSHPLLHFPGRGVEVAKKDIL